MMRLSRQVLVVDRLMNPVKTERAQIQGDRATIFRDRRVAFRLLKIGHEWKTSAFADEAGPPQGKEGN